MAGNEQGVARSGYRGPAVPGAAQPAPRGLALGLVAGDLLVFGLFVAIGRRSHAEGAPLGDIVKVAAPFAIGWLAVAPWAGLYGRAGGAARAAGVRRTLGRTALAWLLACPIGLALRSLAWGHEFKPAFAITTFLFNLGALLLWRGLAARFLGRR